MRVGINISPFARLRGGSPLGEPDPVLAAATAQNAGAQIIVAGWLPNNGFITDRDIKLLRELVRIDLLIISPLSTSYVDAIAKVHPQGVILVDAGWDGVREVRPLQPDVETGEIAEAAATFRAAGVEASIFVEPTASQVKIVAKCGISGVVFDCAAYAATKTDEEAQAAIDLLTDATMAYSKFGIFMAAAHLLDYQNIRHIALMHNIEEIYIGQAVAARAMFVGLDRAVREIIDIIHYSRSER